MNGYRTLFAVTASLFHATIIIQLVIFAEYRHFFLIITWMVYDYKVLSKLLWRTAVGFSFFSAVCYHLPWSKLFTEHVCLSKQTLRTCTRFTLLVPWLPTPEQARNFSRNTWFPCIINYMHAMLYTIQNKCVLCFALARFTNITRWITPSFSKSHCESRGIRSTLT